MNLLISCPHKPYLLTVSSGDTDQFRIEQNTSTATDTKQLEQNGEK